MRLLPDGFGAIPIRQFFSVRQSSVNVNKFDVLEIFTHFSFVSYKLN